MPMNESKFSDPSFQDLKLLRQRTLKRILSFCALLSLIFLCIRFVPAQLAGEKEPYSPYIILKEIKSGAVMAEKNSAEKIYPASLTKMMTAILAIENAPDLSAPVTLGNDLYSPLYLANASLAGFEAGETVSMKDLLYGILLRSGAECCIAFAEAIAYSESDFAGMMNKKADELGMKNTHFTNVTGLHDDDHYSTVSDLSILLEYALQNPVFRTAFTCHSYTTSPTMQHPKGIVFKNTLFETLDRFELTDSMAYMSGGKTGYTKEAGLCLASTALIGQTEYLLITAHADGTHDTEPFHILDAQNLYNRLMKD